MLLFNFKLFFKIAVAILTGTSVSTADSTSADSSFKSETTKPKIETVQLNGEKETEVKFNKVKNILLDSVSVYQDTPKTFKDFKSVIVEK